MKHQNRMSTVRLNGLMKRLWSHSMSDEFVPESKVPTIPGRIPISLIRESEVALRTVNRNSEEYLQLVESIRQKGVLNSVSVREVKDEHGVLTYGLVDGLHRFTAAKDAGLTEIPANITKLDDRELLEAQIIANIHKIETKPVEYTKQMTRILAGNPTLTKRELAARLAKTEAWISQRLSLTKLTDAVAKMVDDDTIKLSNAYALAKLPPEEQANFVDRAATDPPDVFVPAIYARVKEIRDAKIKGKDAAPAQFVPTPHLQKLSEVKKVFDSPDELALMVCRAQQAETPLDGFKAAVAWMLHLDSLSVREQKAEYEARKTQREEANERRKKEREEAKKKAAAEKQADITQL